jgi:hypothetical protein
MLRQLQSKTKDGLQALNDVDAEACLTAMFGPWFADPHDAAGDYIGGVFGNQLDLLPFFEVKGAANLKTRRRVVQDETGDSLGLASGFHEQTGALLEGHSLR